MGKTCYYNINMNLFYKKTIFLLFAILVFFVPLVFTTATVESFEFPKMMLINFIGVLIIMLFLIDKTLSFDGSFNFKIFSKFKFIFPFLVIYIFSTLFSSDLFTSLWSYYSRFNGGLASVILFIGLFFVGFFTLDRDDFLKLFILSIFSSLLVSVYGLLQYYGVLGIPVIHRAYSTIGQPNWLAQYFSMLLPILIYFFTTKTQKFTRMFYILLLISYFLLFWCFWLTFSISGFIGFFISLLFIPSLSELKSNYKRYLILTSISLLVIATNFSFFEARLHDVYLDTKNFVSSIGISYASDLSDLSDLYAEYKVSDPGFIRKEIWLSTINLFLSNPKIFLIGIGPQMFPYEFQQFRSEALNYSSEWEYVVNKPHNYYLELLVEIGIFGLGAYVYLLYYIFSKAPLYLKPSFIGFFITNIFGWPVVTTTLIFWLFASFVCLTYEERQKQSA